MTDHDSKLLQLSNRQRLLFEAIAERDSLLAHRYLGALLVLGDSGNPDYLSLAAHGIRELMDGLPRVVDVALASQGPRMGDKVRHLKELWEKAVNGSACYQKGKWEGTIDGPLRKLFIRLEEFFKWLTVERPERRESAAFFIRALDPSGIPLPKSVEERNAAAWLNFHNYFTDASHHRATNENEFLTELGKLEEFLLGRMVPRPSFDFSTIDSILGDFPTND